MFPANYLFVRLCCCDCIVCFQESNLLSIIRPYHSTKPIIRTKVQIPPNQDVFENRSIPKTGFPPKQKYFQNRFFSETQVLPQQKMIYLPSGKNCFRPNLQARQVESYLRKVRRQRWYCKVMPSQERSNKSLSNYNYMQLYQLLWHGQWS